MTQTRKAARRIHPILYERIETLAMHGWKPGQILRELWRQVGAEEPFKTLYQQDKSIMPSRRTIERAFHDITPQDASPAWSITDQGGEDARGILDVLSTVIWASGGRKNWLTQKEAAWVRLVRKAAPSLGGTRVYQLAREYQLRAETGEDTRDMEGYLALCTWETDDGHSVYDDFVRNGLIEPLRFRWVLGADDDRWGS